MRAIRQITDRAAGRGESPPTPGTIADAILGPLYRRALQGTLPAARRIQQLAAAAPSRWRRAR